ncbi:MAG TPA: NAD(P)/FAD-dependent oxidoreductase [Pyrinomonadaceae bacterium]|nr:NAD(P)/FAD-dependent oxidoreductase [Pyrinomonadaceae bacterium]
MTRSSNYDVIIAGGGPAGTSAAIHLATSGVSVLLAEQKTFPRAKLCGEFISPECAVHFERLGVSDQMLAARPAFLNETVFYSRNGNRVGVPSAWFGANKQALGLSRAEMDERLLRRAVECGVEVLEGAQISSCLIEDDSVRGVRMRTSDRELNIRALMTIDATGRTRALARRFEKPPRRATTRRASLVAFKAHLHGAMVEPGACEIYFYRGGYGGLSSIEGGLSNLCFIASARDVRAFGADAERVMRSIVCQNVRAAITLLNASARSPWLAVSLDGFGRHKPAPVPGLLSIGDAASFIDPFTGSGMLMALESGELAAQVIANRIGAISSDRQLREMAVSYASAYARKFNSRLRLCSMMRRAAFVPGMAGMAIRLFGLSEQLRRRVAEATRNGAGEVEFPVTTS